MDFSDDRKFVSDPRVLRVSLVLEGRRLFMKEIIPFRSNNRCKQTLEISCA